MRNNGLFSTLFIDKIRSEVELDDAGRGRMATLYHARQNSDRTSLDSIWNSYIKQALSYLSFVPPNHPDAPGVYPLYEDYNYFNTVAVLYLIEPGADLDDVSIGRFWPGKLIAQLRDRKLNWGILTDGGKWRLYTTRTGKPFEEYVELDLAESLAQNDEKEYALFERFFHVDSFTPEIGDEENDRREQDARAHGVYNCRLDQDIKASEKILEEKVKSPLLAQIDEVLQYLCNGFIAETPRKGDEYTEDERREIFASTIKLLYRCLFLFYAESRSLLPSQVEKREIYAKHSIGALCIEAHHFRWGKRKDHDGYDLWKHLKGLIGAVNDGDPEYGIMGYNGGLFDDEEEKFLGKEQLRNDFLARALYLMAWVEPHDGDTEKEYPIPYRDLEVRHLGEMYETILEFTVTLADADRLRRRSKKGVEILLASETTRQKGDGIIRKGDVYFGESALERKQTGSYYTPGSLVHFLNAKAVIGPLRDRFKKDYRERFDLFIREAKTGHDATIRRGAAQSAVALVERFVQEVILRFKLCDPAMGSGHFLVNAANQITDFIVDLLAEIPFVEGMASPVTCEPNVWRRLVTRHCLYGVDMNPLAVHLAKLSLWLNGFARDHKLTFLDHHLRCGNSLIGIRSLSQLEKIPERAKDAKKKNKNDTQGALPLPEVLTEAFRKAACDMAAIADIAEDDTDHQKEIHEGARAERINSLLNLADLYTAYLMDGYVSPDDYETLILRLSRGGSPASVAEMEMDDRAKALAGSHRFFHWPLEFPDVFTSEEDGFDADVGNPPWDILKPNSLEFFSAYDPQIRAYKKQQEANQVAERLMADHPPIRQKWKAYGEAFEQQSEYVRQPSAYRALGKGDINTYKLFLERFYDLLKTGGRLGIVTPSGLYTDQGCQPLRELFFNESRIVGLYGFENRRAIFNIHRSFKFILFCTEKGGTTEAFRCAFMEHDPERLPVIDAIALEIQLDHVRKFSPDTLSVMEFRRQRDLDISFHCYKSFPLIGPGMNLTVAREIDLTSHTESLSQQDTGGPKLFEGKMIWNFDCDFAPTSHWLKPTAYDFFYSKDSVNRVVELEKRSKKDVQKITSTGKIELAPERCRLAFREVAADTNERTFIAAILPKPSPHSYTLRTFEHYRPKLSGHDIIFQNDYSMSEVLFWCGVINSYVFDFLARIKTTNHLSTTYMDLPLPKRQDLPIYKEISTHTARLTCTDKRFSDLWNEIFTDRSINLKIRSFQTKETKIIYGPQHEQDIRRRLAEEAANLTPEWSPTCGVHDRAPDRRDTGDRAQLRAEIDAYVAHLYGLSRDEFAYIIDTFPVLKRKEEQTFGEFMSKRKCLEEYDRISNIFG